MPVRTVIDPELRNRLRPLLRIGNTQQAMAVLTNMRGTMDQFYELVDGVMAENLHDRNLSNASSLVMTLPDGQRAYYIGVATNLVSQALNLELKGTPDKRISITTASLVITRFGLSQRDIAIFRSQAIKVIDKLLSNEDLYAASELAFAIKLNGEEARHFKGRVHKLLEAKSTLWPEELMDRTKKAFHILIPKHVLPHRDPITTSL